MRRIARKRVVSASRFLASSECPVCAPFRRVLVFVSAIRVGKIDSRGPVPDMVVREDQRRWRWRARLSRQRRSRHQDSYGYTARASGCLQKKVIAPPQRLNRCIGDFINMVANSLVGRDRLPSTWTIRRMVGLTFEPPLPNQRVRKAQMHFSFLRAS